MVKSMEILRIFVASSIVSFCSERKRMGAFFCEWNNRLIDRSVFLDVKFCEELDNAVPEKRKQDEYNTYIESSDLFILLTDSECGNYTLEEFEVACNSKCSPEILVFCRECPDPFTDNVKKIEKIAGERGRFICYSNFQEQVEAYLHSYVEDRIKQINLSTETAVMPQKLTFFFGASDKCYEDEKNEIMRFVLGLNERILEKGIYIQAVPNSICPLDFTELEETHRKMLNNSETAFFLFFTTVDNLLESDFVYAVERFRDTGSPKIFTYFYNRMPIDDEKILELKRYIDCEMNHYYSEFSNVDSIKLSILIQLSDKYIPGFNITVDNGLICDGVQQQELLNVSALSIFSKNETLRNLRKELENLSKQYEDTARDFALDYKRRDLIVRLSDLDDAINVVVEKIHKEEKETLTLLIEMHRSIANGETKQLVKKAYRYLEAGEIVEASRILNKQVVDTIYGKHLDSQINNLRQEITDAIQLYKHTIHIQKMLEESEETVNTINSCYEEIMRYVDMLNDTDIGVILDYAEYLDEQSSMLTEKIIIKAEYLANNPERKTGLETLARLYDLAGTYYLKQYNSSLAEKYLKKYLSTMEKLYCSDNSTFVFEYAKSCLKYCNISTAEKAKYMERGLKILLNACNENTKSKEYQLELARYYFERGAFYQNYDLQKEMDSYMMAKDILEKRDISDQLLADVYNNIAEAKKAKDNDRTDGASVSRYYDLAIRILENGYKSGPGKYAVALGDLYNNKAVYFIHYGENHYQAIQTLKACEKVYLYLYNRNPVRGGLGLSECYIQMANEYESLGNNKRAISFSEKGIEILENLVNVNRERYAMKLAWAYCETGHLYLILSEKGKISGLTTATEYFCKCLDVLEDTENEFIQRKQVDFVLEMLEALALLVRGKQSIPENIYDVMDRIFKFLYRYIWSGMKTKPGFANTMFDIGYRLVDYFDRKKHEETKAFYYPAMKEICEQRLKDKELGSQEKMFTNFYLAMLVGMLGEVEKGQEYLDQSFASFMESDEMKKQSNIKRSSNSKMKKRKKK